MGSKFFSLGLLIVNKSAKTPIMIRKKPLSNRAEKSFEPSSKPARKTSHHSIQPGDAVAFRAPDQAFCMAFNLAMRISRLNRNDLCVEAIRSGLLQVVEHYENDARSALEEWRQKIHPPESRA
jgi:hypothetical protein